MSAHSNSGSEAKHKQLVATRRRQILDAATKVFAERGFHRARIKQIAREAGVSEGTIYNYFEDKEALLIGILHRLNETEQRGEDFERAKDMDFQGFLEAYLHQRTSLILQNREVFRAVLPELLINDGLRGLYLRQLMAPTMKIAEEYFQAMVELGKIREVNVPLAIRTLAGTVVGLLVLDLLGDEEVGSRWQEIPEVVASIMSGGLESNEDAGQR